MSCLPASALAQRELIYCNVFWPEQTLTENFGRAFERGCGLPMVYMELENETHGVLVYMEMINRHLPDGCKIIEKAPPSGMWTAPPSKVTKVKPSRASGSVYEGESMTSTAASNKIHDEDGCLK